MKKNSHIGSSFDDFLGDDGTLTETSAAAIKRVLAWEIKKAIKDGDITKTARSLGKRLKIELADAG